MTSTSAYIPPHADDIPWGFDWSPEFSRRARGVPVYAALRSLGRAGLADLVDRGCDLAARMAADLAQANGVEVLNEVVLNQVLVRFDGHDAVTDAVIDRVQRDGTCWLSGSTFAGRRVMRISIVGWQTSEHDVELSIAAILAALDDVRAAQPQKLAPDASGPARD
jgi:glutamate/tyrosine decarboxylase-like PLP-dependent enzyme